MLKYSFSYALVAVLFVLAAQERKSQPNRTNAEKQQQNANAQPVTTPVNNPSPQINDEAEAGRERYQKERDAKEDAFKTEQSRQNRIVVRATVWIAIATALNVVVALVYAVVALLQLAEIKKQAAHAGEQVGAMQDNLAETRKITSHNEKTVEAMQGQLDAMKEQAQIMGESLIQTKRAIAASDAQVHIAALAVETAEKSAIYAQRAYLSVAKGEIRGSGFLLRIENSGNSPANDVQMKAVAEMRSGALPVPDPGSTGGSYSYLGLIAPGGYSEPKVTSDIELSGAKQDELVQSGLEWWCAGVITYKDVFGNTRRTKFCFSRHWLSDSLQPWVQGNEAN